MEKYIGKIIAGLAVLVLLAAVFIGGYGWGKRKGDQRIAELATELAKSTETIELTTGLYSQVVVQVEDLTSLLNTKDEKIAALKQTIDEMDGKLLVTEQISLRWKRAYEQALAAQQTEEPPTDPDGTPRKRVEFEGTLGPIKAHGHTLTDPPEAFLKLEQLVPLTLTMNVVQNRDGTWTTLVTSSDDNLDVKVDLAGVDPLVLSQKWYQKIWMELSVGFIGDPLASAGLRYYGDRFSFGAECSAWQGGHSCGGSMGVRIFK